LYDLPKLGLRGVSGILLNGWQISGITELRSGLPIDIRQNQDSTLTGRAAIGAVDIVGPYKRFNPRRYQTFQVNGLTQSGNFFFSPNAFRTVPVVDYTQARAGTLGRNVFTGPGLNLSSASIIKKIRISEPHQISLRADIRNLFNHANFEMPSLSADGSASFGRVSLAAPGRNIQLSLKYSF
jgi:hypothetical protein